MRRTVGALIVVGALLAPANPSPDVREPFPYVRASPTGEAYFKMVPDREVVGRGAAFRVIAASSDLELWSVAGWYSAATHISNDGRYLVRVGSSEGKSLIDFFDGGKLIAQHTVAELIRDPGAFAGESHVSYLMQPWPQFIGAHGFQIVTREQVEITFDYRSGQVVAKRDL